MTEYKEEPSGQQQELAGCPICKKPFTDGSTVCCGNKWWGTHVVKDIDEDGVVYPLERVDPGFGEYVDLDFFLLFPDLDLGPLEPRCCSPLEQLVWSFVALLFAATALYAACRVLL